MILLIYTTYKKFQFIICSPVCDLVSNCLWFLDFCPWMVVLKIFYSVFFSGVKSTWVCGSQILAMVLGCLLHLMVFIIKGTSCKTNSWYVLILPKYMVEIIYWTVVLMMGVSNTTNWEDTLAARVWFSSISEIVFGVGYDRILLSCVRNNWHINLGRLNNMIRQTLPFCQLMFYYKNEVLFLIYKLTR